MHEMNSPRSRQPTTAFFKAFVKQDFDIDASVEFTAYDVRVVGKPMGAADLGERLVGITPVYLQNFVQRGSYGIRASVQSGRGLLRNLYDRQRIFGSS